MNITECRGIVYCNGQLPEGHPGYDVKHNCLTEGHVLSEWYEVTPSTYDTQGEERRDCSECDYYQLAPIALLDHEPGPHATCTEPQICTNCDEVLVPALGHVWGEWYVTVPPTFTEEGLEHRVCTICEIHDSRSIDMLQPMYYK